MSVFIARLRGAGTIRQGGARAPSLWAKAGHGGAQKERHVKHVTHQRVAYADLLSSTQSSILPERAKIQALRSFCI